MNNYYTVADMVAGIKKRLEDTFKDHEYRLVLNSQNTVIWYGNSTGKRLGYWFHVILRPNFIAMYGDIGELILLPRGNKTVLEVFTWLKSCLKNGELDYLSEKVSQELRESIREFDYGTAAIKLSEYLEDCCKDNDYGQEWLKEKKEELEDGLTGCGEFSKDEMYEFMCELLQDYELPSFECWSHRYVYQLAALTDFVNKVSFPADNPVNKLVDMILEQPKDSEYRDLALKIREQAI